MKLFARLYRSYLAFLQWRRAREQADSEQRFECTAAHVVGLTLADVDADATAKGETYRGLGIAVALVGATAALCGLLPIMWELEGRKALAVAFVELALMAVLVGLLIVARQRGRKEDWIRARVTTEYLRYNDLREVLERARAREPKAFDALRATILDLICGSRDQKGYNERKRDQYERIESLAKKATYFGFGLAFVATVIELALNLLGERAEWMIFFTMFVPLLVAALHGVNSFLRLPQLIAQHAEMATALDQMQKRTGTQLTEGQWIELGGELLARLENCDSAWTRIASRVEPQPG